MPSRRERDLFVQVVKAVNAMKIEKAPFRERRDSWRPNFLAIGGALLHIVAASVEGSWVKGAAVGTDGLMAWDSGEGARFADRFLAAAAEIGPALVQLSLMSDGLQSAAAAPCGATVRDTPVGTPVPSRAAAPSPTLRALEGTGRVKTSQAATVSARRTAMALGPLDFWEAGMPQS